MSLLDYLKKNATIENTEGGLYHPTTYNYNLDFFAGISRFQKIDEVREKFDSALIEDETLALANLLLLLDIRGGKGERRLFKICYKYLCENQKDLALKILPLIPELGRWDYIFEGIGTLVNDETIALIKDQFEEDKNSSSPSLLAKWLPSHRTHKKDKPLAKVIYPQLGLTEREYRKTLSAIRKKLHIVESNLTNKDYNINFSCVPMKALFKHRYLFKKECGEKFQAYLEEVAKYNRKINTKGFYCFEIVKTIFHDQLEFFELDYDRLKQERLLLNDMWENQKDFLKGNNSNILVMADMSDSMYEPDRLPVANSIGLAIYIAERNYGFFHNHFLTFSNRPLLQKITGSDIMNKVSNIEEEEDADGTNIDLAFKLLLDAGIEQNLPQSEMPSHIIIISDMEFDQGCYCVGSPEDIEVDNTSEDQISSNYYSTTNLEGWKNAFKKAGYTLPKIIFWNVGCNTKGFPATEQVYDIVKVPRSSPFTFQGNKTIRISGYSSFAYQDNDVAMVYGFSPFVLENILEPENITPKSVMLNTLEKYFKYIQ